LTCWHDAPAVTERVRDDIATLNWDGRCGSGRLGAAPYPDHADDPVELIGLADLAMYAAQAAGKNRGTLAGAAPPATSQAAMASSRLKPVPPVTF
jgi:predicted signal transduction protein with EAL and GGDEF domain